MCGARLRARGPRGAPATLGPVAGASWRGPPAPRARGASRAAGAARQGRAGSAGSRRTHVKVSGRPGDAYDYELVHYYSCALCVQRAAAAASTSNDQSHILRGSCIMRLRT